LRWMIANHLAKPTLGNQPHGMRTILCGKHAIKRRRCAAALQMAEHDNASLAQQAPLDLGCDDRPDAAKLRLGPFASLANDAAFGKRSSLGDHNQSESLAMLFALENLVADVLEGPVDFRNQNHICAAGNSGVQSDPAGMTPHNFQHKDALVTRSGCV